MSDDNQEINDRMLRIAALGEEFALMQLRMVTRTGSLVDTISARDVAALALNTARMARAIEALRVNLLLVQDQTG